MSEKHVMTIPPQPSFDNIHQYFDRMGIPREIDGYRLLAHERLFWLQTHFEAEWIALETAVANKESQS